MQESNTLFEKGIFPQNLINFLSMQELEKKVMVLNEVAKALGIELCSDGYGLLVKERDKDLVLNLRNGDKETDVFPVPNPHFLPEDISGPRK